MFMVMIWAIISAIVALVILIGSNRQNELSSDCLFLIEVIISYRQMNNLTILFKQDVKSYAYIDTNIQLRLHMIPVEPRDGPQQGGVRFDGYEPLPKSHCCLYSNVLQRDMHCKDYCVRLCKRMSDVCSSSP